MSSVAAARARGKRPLGVILYEGPSMIDRAPVVVLATGLRRRSENVKTGDMVQTWILRADVHPFVAIHTGADASVCGDCPLRGIRAGSSQGRACYVSITHAPAGVFDAYRRGRYEPFDARQHLQLFRGRMLRLGAYGDPVAAPYGVWASLCRAARGWTGYTHQWRERRFWRFRRLAMASVETRAQAQEAQARGWRTFRVAPAGEQPAPGEFGCPAAAENGKRTTCERCGACNGAGGNARRVSVLIQAHGGAATIGAYNRRFGGR